MGSGLLCSRFGYWCTDFLVVQRAMACPLHVRRTADPVDRRHPAKIFFPALVILPAGMVAIAMNASGDAPALPLEH